MERISGTFFDARRGMVAGALIASIVVTMGCTSAPAPGEAEEEATATAEVPAVVRDGAASIAQRIGEGRCDAWFWDHEDQNWECNYVGLSREAELDILPAGGFSELELVYGLAEVEQTLPDVATYIRERCRDAPDVVIELSLRREEHLDEIPELAEAWARSGVVLEFQCPNGVDYEIDARNQGVMRKVDDKIDASAQEQATD